MSRKSYPTAVTGAVSSITSTSASLAGQVNPKGTPGTAYFQWGPTSAYGNTTATSSLGSGNSPVGVTASLSGLTSGTVYHYRIVGKNASGTAFGGDATFATTGTIVPDYGISVGGTLQNQGSTLIGQDLDLCANAKSTYVRFDINWAQIQGAGAASYNWTNIDTVVNGIVSRGMTPLGVIVYTPSWAGATANTPPSPSNYAAFCTAAVHHYAPLGVHYYEIWNEPNTTPSWSAPSPAAYTAVLKAAYPAIKAADATATVITAGLSPAPTDGTNYSPCDFLTGIYAAGGHGYFDAVGHHPYCYPANPGDVQTWSAWYQMYGTTPNLVSIMTANGDSAKKIWATEFGAPTNGTGAVSEATQATMISTAMTLFPTYAWAGPIFIYQHRDGGTDTGNDQDWFGMVHYDFTQKASYPAFQSTAGA